jgi:Condensation domain
MPRENPLLLHVQAPGAEAPRTWAQAQMWSYLTWMGRDAVRHNVGAQLSLPVDTDLPLLGRCIEVLHRRHPSLRTTFRADPHRGLVQRVAEDQIVPVEVWRAGTAKALPELRTMVGELFGTHFDIQAAPAVRWAVLVPVEGPATVAFVASHIVCDKIGAEVLRAELDALVAAAGDERLLPEAPEPTTVQAHGQLADTTSRDRRNAYWARILEDLPRTTVSRHPTPTDPASRFRSGALRSRALGPALDLVARRLGASTTAIALAATGLVLCRATGMSRAGLAVVYSNRARPQSRRAVASLIQNVFVTVDGSVGSFSRLVRGTSASALRAYAHSPYDPVALAWMRANVEHRRGIELDVSAYFNDTRARLRASGEGPHDGEPAVTPEELSRLATETSFSWQEHGISREYVRYSLVLSDDVPGWTRLTVPVVDTAFFPVQVAERMTRWVERVVLRAAMEEDEIERILTADAPTSECGYGTWTVVEGCPVDVTSVRRLVADALGTDDVAIQVEPRPEGGGAGLLTAHVFAPSGEPTVGEVHRRCLESLRCRSTFERFPGVPPMWLGDEMAPSRPTAMTPQYYVLHAWAPADRPSEAACWAGIPVVAQGTGRATSPMPESAMGPTSGSAPSQ